MLTVLKDLPNISLYFIIWGLSAYWLKKNKYKLSTLFIAIGIVLFLLCSTSYVPKRLIASVEKAYVPIALDRINNLESHYILVLGAGASINPSLPASMNLSSATLTRLVEGVRIYRYLESAILVTSAASEKGFKSQASISKESAISFGVKEEHIRMLETPNTTLEEAMAFKSQFGTDKNIILVTSAMHMPRAVEIFKDQGLNVIPAPSGYFYKKDLAGYNGITLPSFKSLELMNTYQLTILKHWYYKVFKKQ